MKRFPDGFLWGVATSSYQVEGGIENNDWAKAAREGKVPMAGKACDFYTRYESDLDIAKSLNLSSFRFSVEWARVEPTEGKFDEKEIEFYRNLARACRARGMEPFVTLWHFTLPQWFADSGGFLRADAPAIFARYAAKIAEALKEDAVFFSTMNEPMVWISQGHIAGRWPPFRKNYFAFLTLPALLARAHNAAFDRIKTVYPKSLVGSTVHQIYFEGRNVLGALFAFVADVFWNRRFLKHIEKHRDFIGLNYYLHVPFWRSAAEEREARKSDLGWILSPEGLFHVLQHLKDEGVPVYITEHGLADKNDTNRAWYIRECLSQVLRAIEAGVDVRGYSHWSLLDNFEWAEGFPPRFGLVAIDYDNNLLRTPRKSAFEYATLAKRNAL